MKNIVVVSELFNPPFDEGMKVTAFNLLRSLQKKSNCCRIAINSNEQAIDRGYSVMTNRMLLSRSLWMRLRDLRPESVLYIPFASATMNSFIRTRVLQMYSDCAPVSMLALQKRSYGSVQSRIISMLLNHQTFVPSLDMYNQLNAMHLNVQRIFLGVDLDKYHPVSKKEKLTLRDKYGLSHSKAIVLHCGHIRRSRNLNALAAIAKSGIAQAVVVGSTSTDLDNTLKYELLQNGVYIIDHFIPSIQELYQASDCYIFPVIDNSAAMECPLSVLEAMACNIPVITTRFGNLPDLFEESSDFRYFADESTLGDVLTEVLAVEPSVRGRVERFSWDSVAETLLKGMSRGQ